MKKPVRLLIYASIIGFAWIMLSPALSINTAQIGAPIKSLISGWNTLTIATVTFAIALFITFLITSGWGLIVLGALALFGLVVVSVIHPFLFPLLIPMFALWIFCAAARRKEGTAKAKA